MKNRNTALHNFIITASTKMYLHKRHKCKSDVLVHIKNIVINKIQVRS